jgi:hypothetical protein
MAQGLWRWISERGHRTPFTSTAKPRLSLADTVQRPFLVDIHNMSPESALSQFSSGVALW